MLAVNEVAESIVAKNDSVTADTRVPTLMLSELPIVSASFVTRERISPVE